MALNGHKGIKPSGRGLSPSLITLRERRSDEAGSGIFVMRRQEENATELEVRMGEIGVSIMRAVR